MIELRRVAVPGLVFAYVGERDGGLYLALEVAPQEVLTVDTEGVTRMFCPDALVDVRSATDFTRLEQPAEDDPEFAKWKESISVDWR